MFLCFVTVKMARLKSLIFPPNFSNMIAFGYCENGGNESNIFPLNKSDIFVAAKSLMPYQLIILKRNFYSYPYLLKEFFDFLAG